MKPVAISFRSLVVQAHDLFAVAAAWCLSFAIRFSFDGAVPLLQILGEAVKWLPFVLFSYGLVFLFAGVYRGAWRYSNLQDLRRIVVAVFMAAIIFTAAMVLLQRSNLPRSVLILAPILAGLIMCSARLLYRMHYDGLLLGADSSVKQGDPVVVIGAGDACDQLLRELQRSQKWRAVAVLDDDVLKHGHLMHGVPVLGLPSIYPSVATKYKTKTVILALPSVPHRVRARLAKLCSDAGATVLTVPSFDEIMSGKALTGEVRNIEVEDLLGRDPVTLNESIVREALLGRVVMVTGAGGSIGSELCRQIARFEPSLLVCFELSEHMLYQLKEEFDNKYSNLPLVALTGDVKNAHRVREAIDRYQPHVIFHAAAYKHVPLMEKGNSWEAVRNNVVGTYVVANEAVRALVPKFVMISTDKAVNPTNVMGATKRMAELICQDMQQKGKTVFRTVRFGNVLGSNGSVIPKFQAQIAAGGPITVTHPDIIRYFMSIPEAAQLVLQAASMESQEVGGEILVLDMGDPVRIVDLAKQLIKLSGKNESDIQIEITGLRPGEKLYEELLADGEATLRTHHEKIRIARPTIADASTIEELQAWILQTEPQADDQVRLMLKRFVPEYVSSHNQPVKLQIVESSYKDDVRKARA